MQEAPSIKEALEYEKSIREKVWASACLTASEWIYLVGVFQAANEHEECPALATLQPDGERREAIARILADPKHQERARYVQGFLYGDDYVIRDVALRENQELFRTKDEHEYEQRLEIEKAKFAAGAILASGLVQNEAGIRRDERIPQPIGYTEVGKMIDAGIKAVDLYNIASADILRRTDIRAFLEAALAIRSARDGGAE